MANADPESYEFRAQSLALLTPLRTLRGHQESVTSLQLVSGSTGGGQARDGELLAGRSNAWQVTTSQQVCLASRALLGDPNQGQTCKPGRISTVRRGPGN